MKHIVKGKVDSSVASTYSYTTTAICVCGVRGKVGGDLDSSEFLLQNVNDLQLRPCLYLLSVGVMLGGRAAGMYHMVIPLIGDWQHGKIRI